MISRYLRTLRRHNPVKLFSSSGIMKTFVFVLMAASHVVSGSDKVIQKCCLKHEELHPNGRDCVRRPAYRNDVPIANGVAESSNEMDIVDSLPEPFNMTDLRVKYLDVSPCKFNNFLLLNLNDTPRYKVWNMTLQVKFSGISGGTFKQLFNETQYCLDSIQNKNDTLMIKVCTKGMSHAKKCCPEGELMRRNRDGKLECIEEIDPWSLEDSVFKKYAHENTAKDILENVISLCTPKNFDISHHHLQNNSSSPPNIFTNSSFEKFLRYEFVCIGRYHSRHRNSKGREEKAKEVVGVCSRSNEYLQSFFKVHHLCPAAAVLLALSIGAIIIRPELRKSLHGQALASHAVALLFASTLRAVWWYSQWFFPNKSAQCNTLAYTLNYFMVASAIWLNIICINTVIEIRNSETGGKMPGIRTIVWFSVYGWVIPAFHTLLVVLQPWQENENSKSKSHVFHTRTCFFKDDMANHHKLEKFLFYYGPMTAILIANIALLIYSVTKCKNLQNSLTAMQGGERKVRPMSSKTVPEQALMYSRLLISAGVGEMSAEIIAWALNDPTKHGPDGSRLAERSLLRQEVSEKEFTFWILATTFDFLRALSVFILCCLSRRTVRAVKHLCKGYVRLDRPSPARLSWPFASWRSHRSGAQECMVMEPLTPPR